MPSSNPLFKLTRGVASSWAGTLVFSKLMPGADRLVFRLSSGRRSAASLLTGLPIILLTTIGAKSGQARTVPLLSIPHGDGYIIIASNWGQKNYPAWYHNLRANPEVSVVVQGQAAGTFLARETEGEERERLWDIALRHYPGYAGYERRAGGRVIPVILLIPITKRNSSPAR